MARHGIRVRARRDLARRQLAHGARPRGSRTSTSPGCRCSSGSYSPCRSAGCQARSPAYPAIITTTGLLYTIPSLALFVMMPLLLGTKILDPVNVVVAMTIYTVALLVRIVADGLARGARPRRAGRDGHGLPGRCAGSFGVELPLAVPVIAAGLRVAAVSNVSIVSVASIIGVSQLGDLLVDGYNRVIWGELLTGILACVLLALVLDVVIQAGLGPSRRGCERRGVGRDPLTDRLVRRPGQLAGGGRHPAPVARPPGLHPVRPSCWLQRWRSPSGCGSPHPAVLAGWCRSPTRARGAERSACSSPCRCCSAPDLGDPGIPRASIVVLVILGDPADPRGHVRRIKGAVPRRRGTPRAGRITGSQVARQVEVPNAAAAAAVGSPARRCCRSSRPPRSPRWSGSVAGEVPDRRDRPGRLPARRRWGAARGAARGGARRRAGARAASGRLARSGRGRPPECWRARGGPARCQWSREGFSRRRG